MPHQLKIVRESHPEPETLFIERYDRIFAWSLQLTDYDRDVAEDLLHDLFIQFVLNGPDPSSIENLDGYLYVTLRNLHLAQRRRSNRNRLVQLSIIEYDSAEIGLSTIDFRDQLAAQEELRRVCVYACARKETAKIASVLILRFFHGYYPDEITQIAGSPRSAIDKWLRLARIEAKASLDKNNDLKFIDRPDFAEVSRVEYAHQPEGILQELRETIFRSRQSECLDQKLLNALYLRSEMLPINCAVLAHIVSCPVCLDSVNHLLGLELLAERRATETLTRDKGKKDDPDKGGNGGDSGTGGGMSNSVLGTLRRRVKDTFVHKPQELCVAVNGYALGSHRVTAKRSELNLVVERDDKIDFVEVYSEQKVRLLMHNIENLPPVGPGERSARVRLSDGRELELSLRFTSPSPTIQVIYFNPTFNLAEIAENEAFEARDLIYASYEGRRAPVSDNGMAISTTSNDRSDVIHTSLLGLDGNKIAPPKGFAGRLIENLTSFGFWLRPATIAVAFSCLLVGSILYFTLAPKTPTATTAPEILRQAASAEEALLARNDTVIHRTINFEKRNIATGEVGSRRRIEIWQSGDQGSARRLFDEKGRLLAGEFTSNGNSTVYTKKDSRRAAEQPNLGGEAREFSADTAWQFTPSVTDFEKLVAQATSQLTDNGDKYLISYQADDSSTVGVFKAELTINKADLRPVEQILVIRQHGPNAADELVEYRFVESSFEQRAPSAVAPSVFEPDAELLVPDVAVVKKSEANAATASPIAAANAVASTSAIATADFEVEVLRLLNQAGADIDDQTNVTRTSDGKLLVTGLVDTKEKKNEVLRALEPVAGNPALAIRVETYAEAAARQKQSVAAPTSVEKIEVNKGRIAVFDDVVRYLGTSDDEAVRRFSASVLNRSRSVMSQAGTLKKLAGRFSKDDLKSMTPDAREKWLVMVRAQARNVEADTRRLRQDLQSVFGINAGGTGTAFAISSDNELQRVAAQLFASTAANDRVIRSAFTISADAASVSPIKTQQFFRALATVESTAASLQRVK